MNLFERVKSTADIRGFTLAELSRKAGIGEKSIYAWRPSKKYPEGIRPKHVTLQKLADVLGVSVDYLLGNTDEMMPNKKSSSAGPEEIDLDAALEDKGVVMRFQGKELSDKAKRGILDIIKLVDGDED